MRFARLTRAVLPVLAMTVIGVLGSTQAASAAPATTTHTTVVAKKTTKAAAHKAKKTTKKTKKSKAPKTSSAAPLSKAIAAHNATVPGAWRGALPVNITGPIGGVSSSSSTNGTITVSLYHTRQSAGLLRNVMAHEFGHQIAFHYGTQARVGAPPAGFPQTTRDTRETWADCVAWAWSGVHRSGTNAPPCNRTALGWTRAWLNAGPNGHPSTG